MDWLPGFPVTQPLILPEPKAYPMSHACRHRLT